MTQPAPGVPMPDRLSVEPESQFYRPDLIHHIGVRFDGKERPGDVVEFCVSENWIRIWIRQANGRVIRERGKARTVKLPGKVEPFFKTGVQHGMENEPKHINAR